MTYPALFIRKAQITLLVLLLCLGAPNLAVHAVGSGKPKPPPAPCKILAPEGWRPYRVKLGETLAMLAKQHGVTEEQLRLVNCLQNSTIKLNFLLLAPNNSISDKLTITASMQLTLTLPVHSLPTHSPTVTPTVPPAPTATATVTPTVPPAPTATATVMPTVELTLTIKSAITPTVLPTATIQSATDGQVKPPPAVRAAAIPPAPGVGDGATNGAGQLWFMVALLLVMIALTGYFSLGDAMPRVVANHRFFSFIGYALFILAGFLAGLFATSLFQPTSPFSLPAFSGGVGTVLLIGLLALKEVTSPWGGQGRIWHRLVSLALIPLLAIFLIAVVSRIAAFLR